jgi:hypothetical protein
MSCWRPPAIIAGVLMPPPEFEVLPQVRDIVRHLPATHVDRAARHELAHCNAWRSTSRSQPNNIPPLRSLPRQALIRAPAPLPRRHMKMSQDSRQVVGLRDHGQAAEVTALCGKLAATVLALAFCDDLQGPCWQRPL